MHVTQYRAEYRRHRRSQPGRRGLAASTSEERRCRSLLYSVSPLFPSFPSLVEKSWKTGPRGISVNEDEDTAGGKRGNLTRNVGRSLAD